MGKRWFVWVTVLGSLVAVSGVSAQVQSGVYRVVSGEYSEIGGIVPLRYALPTEFQAYVQLTIEQNGSATLTFLREDMQTPSSFRPCWNPPPTEFRLSQGAVFADHILFPPVQGSCPISGGYTVHNSPNRLRINGRFTSDPSPPGTVVSDFPSRFTHTNVVAVLMPEPVIRVSEFEVGWLTAPNATYQVQYRNELTTNTWTNLGTPHAGDGATNCVTDRVPAGQPRRFYRVLPVP